MLHTPWRSIITTWTLPASPHPLSLPAPNSYNANAKDRPLLRYKTTSIGRIRSQTVDRLEDFSLKRRIRLRYRRVSVLSYLSGDCAVAVLLLVGVLSYKHCGRDWRPEQWHTKMLCVLVISLGSASPRRRLCHYRDNPRSFVHGAPQCRTR